MKKTKLTTTLIIVMSTILFSLVVTAREGEEFIYVFNASLAKNLDKITLEEINNLRINIQSSDELTRALTIRTKLQKSYFNKEDGFSGLVIEDFSQLGESELKDNSFLLISTRSKIEINLSEAKNTKLKLTGFSLNDKNYTLTLGSANYFSWGSEGWISNDPDPLFSGYLGLSNYDHSGEGELIYLELLSNELSDQLEDGER